MFHLDFFCPELALAIEIDGNSHDSDDAYKKDIERQQNIERLGIRFLRFNDSDVKRNMPHVLSAIERWVNVLQERTHPVAARHPSQEGNV